MEITPQERRILQEVVPSMSQTFCILFWKMDEGPKAEKKVLMRINSNGVPVSTKKYSEVFFFSDVRHTLVFCTHLFKYGYDVKIHKCNRKGKDGFWLTGAIT